MFLIKSGLFSVFDHRQTMAVQLVGIGLFVGQATALLQPQLDPS
jgi:hypothetical protein